MRKRTVISQPQWLQQLGSVLDQPLGNGIWFYLLWLSAVLGQEAWFPLTLGLIGVHILAAKDALAELVSGLPLAALGTLLDSALIQAGVLVFETYQWAPPWLAALWLGFALCLHRCLQYFTRSRLLCITVGGLGGAFSYWSGMKLGAVGFGYNHVLSIAVLALAWAVVFPSFVFINQWIRLQLSRSRTA